MIFEDDDFEEMDDEEMEREMEEERNRKANLPIVKKAKEIFRTVHSLIATIDYEKDTMAYRDILFEDIAIINAKISGAEAMTLYSLKMENAVLIKIHARSIITTTSGMKMMKLGHEDYLNVLRDEMEEFRKLFVECINTFDKTNDIPDDWGIEFS